MADRQRTSATSGRAGGRVMDFPRTFARPFLMRTTDRGGLILGALVEAAEADRALAEHLLRALAVAEAADPPEDTGIPTPRLPE